MNGKTGLIKFICLLTAISILAVVLSSCGRPGGNEGRALSSAGPSVNAATYRQSYGNTKETSGTVGAKSTSDAGGKTSDSKNSKTGSGQTGVAAKGAAKAGSAAQKETKQTMAQPGTVAQNDENSNCVHISITGPEKAGVILKETPVVFEQGDTVLDVLRKVTKEKNIQMEYRGTDSLAYVRGIANVYEFDYGAESGWIYKVDGKVAGIGSGAYPIKKGDIIEWLYTLDMGKEFGSGVGGK